MEIVFGGDHGQGVFGAAVKVILVDPVRKVVNSAVEKVGHIDCRKDTYNVLKQTIANPLNKSLKSMKGTKIWYLLEIDSSNVPERDVDLVDRGVGFVKAKEAATANSSDRTVKLLRIGNLAFIAMALGHGQYGWFMVSLVFRISNVLATPQTRKWRSTNAARNAADFSSPCDLR